MSRCILPSFLKRSSAELLRRAARDAPNGNLQARILGLADEEEQAAEELARLAPPAP